jgi:hypothetical protein
MISVHDNHIYGFAASSTKQRFVLHTKFPLENQAWEFTDVVFDGVVAMRIDDICMSQSILGEVYEKSATVFFDTFEDVLKVEEKWGIKHSYLWLPFKYINKEDFIEKIQANSLLCFEVDSSWGLNGFVIAKCCTRISRDSEAEIV